MFFNEWRQGLKRDKQQLYRVTGQVLRLHQELAALEDAQHQIKDDLKYDIERRTKFQQVQLDELYKTIAQITQELDDIKGVNNPINIALKKDIKNVQSEVDALTARVTLIEKNNQQNGSGEK